MRAVPTSRRRASARPRDRDNLDVSLGKHSVRTGVLVGGAFFDSTVIQNANGTFTLRSLDDYEAGTPRTFGVRQGDRRRLLDVAVCVVRPGRHQAPQGLHLERWCPSGGSRISTTGSTSRPRIGIAGRRTRRTHDVRGGAGISTTGTSDTYEQTLQVDGDGSATWSSLPGYPTVSAERRSSSLPGDPQRRHSDATLGSSMAWSDRLATRRA